MDKTNIREKKIPKETIDLAIQAIDEGAMKNEDIRKAAPMIKLTLATIEDKGEYYIGMLVMTIFQLLCAQNQVALIKQFKEISVHTMIKELTTELTKELSPEDMAKIKEDLLNFKKKNNDNNEQND